MRRAVFLDRDGVLNAPVVRDGRPYPPASMDELRIYDDAAESLRRLKNAGFLLIVVTNQPDVSRGAQAKDTVDALNAALSEVLPIDEFRTCYHDDVDGCSCRKPKPGLLVEGARKWGVEVEESYMIGDRWRDIDAGAAAGCRTILIDRHYREKGPANKPDFTASTLTEAADWILAACHDAL